MASRNLTMGIIFLSQTALGILGNCVCFGYLIFSDVTGSRVKLTDLIVKHLTWANFLVHVFKGIPQTLAALGLIDFLDDVSCKLIFYFHRVARGVSLGSTSLLSIVQAITISPSKSKWLQLKVRARKVIGSSLGLCWALQLLLNAFIPRIVTSLLGARNRTGFRDFIYCGIVESHHVSHPIYRFLLASIDAICLGLVTWASGSMVFLLWEHQQRVQHIHRSLSLQKSPETRATQSILALGSSFVLLNITSAILNICFSFFDLTSGWVIHVNVAMSACFPAFCPFLLLIQSTSSKHCCICSYVMARGSCTAREH